MEDILNLIGLMAKSGNIVSGEENLIKNIKNKNINLLIVSSDCGKNTKKKLINKAYYYDIDTISCFTINELSKAIGKDNREAIGVTNKKIIKKIINMIKNK